MTKTGRVLRFVPVAVCPRCSIFRLSNRQPTWFQCLQQQASQWSDYARGPAAVVLMQRKEGFINTKRVLARDVKSAAICRLTKRRKERIELQPRHLAIVRAALTFWDEEMSAASHETYRHYLHSRDQEEVIFPKDVAETRAYFNQVIPKFGLLDLQTGTLVSKSLVENRHDLDFKHG